VADVNSKADAKSKPAAKPKAAPKAQLPAKVINLPVPVKPASRALTVADPGIYGVQPVEKVAAYIDVRRPVRQALLISGAFIAAFIFWGTMVPLESGAMASGVVASSSSRKTIQHLEGGIIAKINVKDGDRVTAGDALIELDDTSASAAAGSYQGQLWSSLAHQARLLAQRDGLKAIQYPKELTDHADDPQVREILTVQQNAFEAQRRTTEDARSFVVAQVGQLRAEIAAINRQKAALGERLALVQEETRSVESLLKDGYERRPRLLALQRLAAETDAQIQEQQTLISRAEQRISDSQLRLLDLETKLRNAAADELRSVEERISTLREQVRASGDVLARRVIRAPQDGIIMGLRFHTVGGVIPPGQAIMDLVPVDDEMVITTQVRPDDIDVVHVGMAARVVLTAFKRRTTPTLEGEVVMVSADRVDDPQTRASYFPAKIKILPGQLEHLDHVHLSPGMPAEVMVVTGERTLFAYLTQPFRDIARKAFVED
jgi:HlyD family type I secretion membrane fusion protein